MYTVAIDEPDNVLNITTSGFWTIDEAERYVSDLKTAAAIARNRRGRLRAAVNALDAPVQSGDVMNIVADAWSALLTDPGDRVALMVDSSLAKMQSKRLFTSEHWQAFLSPMAARTWLNA